MREVVLDTETTGLSPMEGHRIVEIGAVELMNHMPTGRTYHQYINPDRDMPQEAFDVHGISAEFLADKPRFPQVASAFLDFVGDSKMVIHNAAFDMRFLNAELQWCDHPTLPNDQALDTLAIARSRFPGSPASLDALCRRFNIDNSAREKHGALLDSEILAEVYLELVGGKQPGLSLTSEPQKPPKTSHQEVPQDRLGARPVPLPTTVTEEEAAAHQAFVQKLGEAALWTQS